MATSSKKLKFLRRSAGASSKSTFVFNIEKASVGSKIYSSIAKVDNPLFNFPGESLGDISRNQSKPDIEFNSVWAPRLIHKLQLEELFKTKTLTRI